MSFDLYVWKGPIVRTGEAASALVGRSLDATSPFDPSADVVGFYRELIATYPPLEAFPEADLIAGTATTHWSVSPGPSDRFIEMHLQWGTPDKVLDFITALARRHALVLFDPQGPDVHLPDDPEEWPPFTLAAAIRALVAGLVGAVIAVVGWVVAIPLVSGIAIVVGGFLAVMAVYTFIAQCLRALR
jgi:hypothetical protein